MKGEPLVSVIIPFLDAEDFIEQAIESVLGQTYRNWELFLVDDGSSDKSTNIAKRYAKEHERRLRYLEHDAHRNRGASATRNLGISHSNGEYLAFLDADDLWLPEKLERQVAVLSSEPSAAMLYGASQWWYSWTGNSFDIERDKILPLGVQSNVLVKPPELLILFLEGKATVPCPSNILVRREVMRSVRGFEESIRRLYTDQSFYAKICLEHPVLVSGDCLDRYRQHPNSCYSRGKATGERDSARLFYLEWLENYLSTQGFTDPGVWRALKRKQRRHRYPALYRLATGTQHHINQLSDRLKSFYASK
jgi:glycosyltransferase involved in cell wall biosynthesis